MKKILLLLAIASLASFLIVGTASAALYTPDKATLLGMGLAWDNGGLGDLDAGSPTDIGALGVLFTGEIFTGTPQWRSIGLGYPWPTSPPVNNLSAFTGYQLHFYNANNQNWWVNLYMNTGWTDAPWSEPDNFYQNGWTELGVGEGATLLLDFGTEGVINEDHVTNFGFQLAFNDPTIIPGTSNYAGDNYAMQVGAVPVPGAIWLFGTGLMGLVGMRRKFQK